MLCKNVYQWKWNLHILYVYIVVITWNCSAADVNSSVNSIDFIGASRRPWWALHFFIMISGPMFCPCQHQPCLCDAPDKPRVVILNRLWLWLWLRLTKLSLESPSRSWHKVVFILRHHMSCDITILLNLTSTNQPTFAHRHLSKWDIISSVSVLVWHLPLEC